jgi:hypothetical protein
MKIHWQSMLAWSMYIFMLICTMLPDRHRSKIGWLRREDGQTPGRLESFLGVLVGFPLCGLILVYLGVVFAWTGRLLLIPAKDIIGR